MTAARPVITLTTDFGTSDHYVAAMKGVILGINPDATIVDISHAVRPQQVAEGAFLLQAVRPYFPTGTVHLAVVDPGVGTERRALILATPDGFFVGPDNGVLSPALPDSARPRSPLAQGREQLVGVGFVLRVDGQGKTLEIRIARVAAIGCHQSGVADANARMHHLVLVGRRAHRLVGTVLPTHQHRHLGAERLLIEIERLVAAAVEEQIGLNLHGFSSTGSD